MSAKLIFRKLKNSDADELFEIYSDKVAMRFRGSKPMENLKDAMEFINNQEFIEEHRKTIRKAIELDDNKVLVGTVMYRFIEDRKEECEIGYSIGQKYWGQGLGTKIVGLMLEELRTKMAITRIVAYSNEDNIASIKLLERNGFVLIETNNDGVFTFFKPN